MKTRVTAVTLVLLIFSWCLPVSAAESGDVAVDTVVVRPVCFLATLVGSALFVVSLPIALMSKSVKPAAHALVQRPAYATFKRPLGDFDDLRGDMED